MKNKKQFDCVKMMREIRDKISLEIANMTPEQILEYIRKGRQDYEKMLASRVIGGCSQWRDSGSLDNNVDN